MDLRSVLDEQASYNFTGRINILRAKNKQYLGVIFFLDGELVNCDFGEEKEEKAFLSVIHESQQDKEKMVYLVEPEIITPDAVKIDKHYKEFFERPDRKGGRRPPDEVRLLIDGQFIISGKSVTGEEFTLMKSMTEYNKTEDIYKNCELEEDVITESLVQLRKKGAIKVIG